MRESDLSDIDLKCDRKVSFDKIDISFLAGAFSSNFSIIINKSGYNDTTFGADDPITREQMAAIIVNAFKLQQSQEGKMFGDQDEISPWAQEAIQIAASNGIIAGYEDGTFKPKNHATRAEAVTVLVRILENV